MSIIKLDVSTSPDPPTAVLQLDASPKSLGISVASLDLSFGVKPATGTIVGGAIAGAIVGLFAGPAGALLGGAGGVAAVEGIAALTQNALNDSVPSKVKDTVKTKGTKSFSKPIGFTINIPHVDVEIEVEAESLSLGTDSHNEMLMAYGQVKVT
ncbi:MAG: hypothetical protein AAGC60_19575 [Acidobacteriota bacterium]